MARAIGNAAVRDGFLPDGMARFLRRRAVEGAGFATLALALLVATALATFDPADPSFNVAVERPATNALGHPGAYLADILLHSLGAAAALLALVIAAWGVRLILHRPLRRAWRRLLLLAPGLLAAATALTFVPTPADWPVSGGLGGLVGRLGLGWLAALVAPIPAWSVAPIGMGLAAVAACLISMAAGLPLADLGRAAVVATRLLWRAARGAAALVRRRRDAADETAPLFRIHDVEEDEIPDEPPLADDDPDPTLERPAPPAAPAQRAEPDADAATRRRGLRARQRRLDLAPAGSFRLPPLDLLDPGQGEGSQRLSKTQLEQNGRLLESVLDDFGVKGRILGARPGPVVTLYELEPAPGTKSSRVISLADDIARSMSAISVRVAVVPGRNVIGIELPNQSRETVYLRPILQAETWERSKAKLGLALGRDIGGEPVIADLARMPHLLVAGTTGSGKSVAINTMILSILYRHPPERCRFIMIDPKMLELSVYDQIPHLLSPVVTDPKKAVVALKWTVREMEDRYRAMSKLGVRNIDGYNQRIAEALKRGEVLKRRVQTGFDPDTGKPVFEDQPFDMEPLPYIIVVVDEMADLMLVAGKDIEAAIQRLAQMARAAGIHIIMATQRPSVDVITGTIKANFPTRISFQVTSKIDSRTILGEQGAEQLLGMGDMLYMAGGGRITRVHGPFVTDGEVEEVCAALREQGEPDYIDAVTEDDDEDGTAALGLAGGADGESGDALYDQAVALVCRERKASTSFVQRHLQIGYNRAARLIERMEAEGVISGANHVGKREVLARNIEDDAA